MKVACAASPKLGGSFTFVRRLRLALAARGIEVVCVAIGAEDCKLADPRVDFDAYYRVAPHEKDLAICARALVSWIAENDVSVLITMNSAIALASIPHLPDSVLAINRCGSMTRHAYAIATTNAAYVDVVVAVNDRIFSALQARLPGVPIAKIENGVSQDLVISERTLIDLFNRRTSETPRLLYSGRLSHEDKGVLYLPGIIRALRAIRPGSFVVDIIGDGPDRSKLMAALKNELRAGIVHFHGTLPPDALRERLQAASVCLLPSNFEGSPSALIEAMVLGVVPVCSLIPGVTDKLIADGVNGFLSDPRSPAGFARSLRDALAFATEQDRVVQCYTSALQKFHPDSVADRWIALLCTSRPLHVARLSRTSDWSAFRAPNHLRRRAWKSLVPVSLKIALRRWLPV